MKTHKKTSEEFMKPAGRFMTIDEAAAFAQRAKSKVSGGGDLSLYFTSSWSGSSRCARNTLLGSGDLRQNRVHVYRDMLGAAARVTANQIDDIGIESAIRRAERILVNMPFSGDRQFREHYGELSTIGPEIHNEENENETTGMFTQSSELTNLVQEVESYSKPKLFFDSTYSLQSEERLESLRSIVDTVNKEKLFTAAFIEAKASGRAVMDTLGRSLYYPYTESQYSVTVRDAEANASGWAGVDFGDWNRINAQVLTEIAIDKCLRSRNPVGIEPGRYTTILEPQAVSDILSPLISPERGAFSRIHAHAGNGPFALVDEYTKIGLKVMDERITISSDPMDPDIGFPPFDEGGNVYHPVKWIENGILKELFYPRSWAIRNLGINTGLPMSGAYRMNGGSSSIDDMIANTKRGVLVTRFSNVRLTGDSTPLAHGYTRDGFWLIENGKISKAIKNFRFLESPLFIFNQLEALGPAVKVFHPGRPVVVPSAKVRDFNFVSTIDAV